MASAAVEFALSKLGQLAISEATFLLGLEDEIGHIKIKLEWLSKFLADADQKRRHKKHELVGVWVSQLREVAYDLEDVLDEYTVKLDLQRMGLSGWRASRWLHCCISPNTQLLTRHDLTSKIRKIKATLDVIESNKAKFLDPTDASSSLQVCADLRINNLRTEVDAEPTGQNTYVQKLIPQILNVNTNKLAVISICGMGGLGKTTLAKRLYNDREVKSHFNLCAWLTISQTFIGVDLLRRLMDQLKLKEDTMKMKEEEMKRKLEEHLSKKSFVIVLDDIWEVSSWEYLKTIFPREHEGITVLLTTRDKNVATGVDPDGEPFELHPLEPEESWQLFCRKAFIDANCPKNFQTHKDAIIKRSKGLPLAIIVLGGLLRKRKDPNQWKKILEQPRREEDETLSILSLSYDYLPHHLKACFLYVAGYPEDHKIDAEKLMQMWIAEGFIKQRQGQTMEDSAEEYLEELMQRSLIQLVERDVLGHVASIRVHDLVLDMARKEAEEVHFLHRNTTQQSSTFIRRLSFNDKDVIKEHSCQQNQSTPNLRSLCFHHSEILKEKFSSKYFTFHPTKFLRVLSLQNVEFQNGKCPEAIGNMIQLRYLDFSRTNLKELPKNISNLKNLQTIDLRYTDVTRQPKKFWEITTLRHVRSWSNVEINKQDVNKLNELQTIEGRLNGIANYKWIINDGLRKLTNIRKLTLSINGDLPLGSQEIDLGKMEEKLIDAIENLKHLAWLSLEGELASINVLTSSNASLQYLTLRWRRRRENGEDEKNAVLKQDYRHQLLPNLHTLIFNQMYLTEDEMDVIGLLPNLKFLDISLDDQLTRLVFKEGSFSCLKILCLFHCYKLESWEVDGDRPLQRVEIVECSKLKMLPRGVQLEEIELQGMLSDDEACSWAKEMAESSPNTIVKHDKRTCGL